MVNYNQFEMLLTGIGISSAIGQGKVDFASSLMQGQQVFGVMKRPGRQKGSAFIGAEIQALHYPERFSN